MLSPPRQMFHKNVGGKQAWQNRFLEDMAKYRDQTKRCSSETVKPAVSV